MALVDTTTGEIVAACSPDEARRLTDEIRGAAERVWSLLLEAHDRQAWSALGYSTWADYVQAEFDMSRSRSYQMLDQGRVIRAIEEVTGVSTKVDISEREARDLKPHLDSVIGSIEEGLAAEPDIDPDRAQKIVDDAIAEGRAKARQAAEDRAAMADLNEKGRAAGMDLDEKSLAERGGFSRLCMDLSKLAEPADFLARHRAHLTPRHIAQAERAYAWLDTFLLELKEGE